MVTSAQAYWLNRKRRRARNEGVGVPAGYSLVTYNGELVTYNGKRVLTDGRALYVEV